MTSNMLLRRGLRWLWVGGLIVLIAMGIGQRSLWWPLLQNFVHKSIAATRSKPAIPPHAHSHGVAVDHDDGHSQGAHEHGHEDSLFLELSPQALANLGLSAEYLTPVKLETFRRSITVPGIVVDRPGRTRVEISTPMAGVVTHVHAVQGEAVTPGTLLFELRITAEELVDTQTNLLKTVGELDVENREIARLSKATETGAVSQKTLLEREYAKEKLEVLLRVQREALRLHGLSDRQIEEITTHQRLLRDLQIVAPSRDRHGNDELRFSDTHARPLSLPQNSSISADPDENAVRAEEASPVREGHADDSDDAPLVLQSVLIHKGETVAAGTTLAVLADYSELYIEGRAFEQDFAVLSESRLHDWKIEALIEGANNSVQRLENLDLVYSASEIDVASRSLSFFVRLPNEIAREVPSPNGQRFLDWKYRPGQRLQLRVPVEEWKDQIVLPVDAVAREGAESFVFQQNGSRYERVPVHVSYRDAIQVVIENDGSVFPGVIVALRGAHQMQMALKNKSGGGVDPHAGHTH